MIALILALILMGPIALIVLIGVITQMVKNKAAKRLMADMEEVCALRSGNDRPLPKPFNNPAHIKDYNLPKYEIVFPDGRRMEDYNR